MNTSVSIFTLLVNANRFRKGNKHNALVWRTRDETKYYSINVMVLCRCIDFRYQRGGNASNNCTVISQFGQPCEFLGVLSNEQFSRFLQDDMRKHKIDFSHCPITEDGACPTSVVILSTSTGSRTILHHDQNHAEITMQVFEKLNLEDYSWVHFEVSRILSKFLCDVNIVFNMVKYFFPSREGILQRFC